MMIFLSYTGKVISSFRPPGALPQGNLNVIE
jgi:hypothetical protein